jgi:hypothetical protein
MGDDVYAPPVAARHQVGASAAEQAGILTRAVASALCAGCSVLYILIALRVTSEFTQLGIEPIGLCGLLVAKATIALHGSLIGAAWLPHRISFGTRYVRPLSVGMLCFAVSLSMTVVAVFAPLIQVVEALGRSASC